MQKEIKTQTASQSFNQLSINDAKSKFSNGTYSKAYHFFKEGEEVKATISYVNNKLNLAECKGYSTKNNKEYCFPIVYTSVVSFTNSLNNDEAKRGQIIPVTFIPLSEGLLSYLEANNVSEITLIAEKWSIDAKDGKEAKSGISLKPIIK